MIIEEVQMIFISHFYIYLSLRMMGRFYFTLGLFFSDLCLPVRMLFSNRFMKEQRDKRLEALYTLEGKGR